MRLIFRLCLFATALWLAGFFWFVTSLPRANPADFALQTTDLQAGRQTGIVVLTGGGGARIEAALDLLRDYPDQRLLITGVNPATGKADLAASLPAAAAMLECCVDLGQRALTTKGNAIETRDWVRTRGYQRIVLVTTDYHLPRAIAEIRALLPTTEIIAYPVASRRAPAKGWLSSPQALTVLAKEYTKFLTVRGLQFLGLD